MQNIKIRCYIYNIFGRDTKYKLVLINERFMPILQSVTRKIAIGNIGFAFWKANKFFFSHTVDFTLFRFHIFQKETHPSFVTEM